MTVGAADTANCDSPWVETFTEDGACLVRIESFSIGSQTFPVGDIHATSTETPFIITPTKVFDAIVVATGAEYDFQSDTYVMECAKRGSMPDMVFRLPEMDYRVPAADYARKLSVSDSRCILMVKNYDGEPNYWYLGTAFLRPYCTLLDYAGQKW